MIGAAFSPGEARSVFTQCSKCETVFRLSAQTLRAAGGQVRCGRCGEVFDALTRLAEDPTAFIQGDSPRAMEARADVILEFPPSQDLSVDIAAEDDEEAGTVGMARLHFLEPLPGDTGEYGGTDAAGTAFERSLEFTLPADDLDRVFFVDSGPNLLRQLIDDAEVAPHPELTPHPQLPSSPELPPHPESQTRFTPAPHSLVPQAYQPVEDDERRFAIAPVPPEFAWRELGRRDPNRREVEQPSGGPPLPPASAAAGTAPDPSTAGDALSSPVAPATPGAPPRAPSDRPAASAATQPAPPPAGSAAPRTPGFDVDDDIRRAMLAAYAKPLPSLATPMPPLLPFRAWLAAAIVLGCVLTVQVVLGNRDWLAAHSPGAGVSSLFSLVGVPVSPQANLSVYQLRQWGVSGDPDTPGTLRVRASILNTAAQLEPYPLLRITLANRFGAHIGARAFEPAEYLGKPASRLLSPGERLDATLDILDPGKDAEGFEIDVCLRDSRKRLYCAGDVAAPR